MNHRGVQDRLGTVIAPVSTPDPSKPSLWDFSPPSDRSGASHAVAASSDAPDVQSGEGGSQPTLLLHYPYLTDDGLPVLRPLYGLASRPRPDGPRSMTVERCDVETIIALNGSWHSVLPDVGVNFGVFGYVATYLDVVYASALWSRPIAANRLRDGFRKMELRRMAVGPDAPRHTASWFLSVMSRLVLRLPNVIGLISYQATDVHRGTMYKAAGWRSCGEQPFVPWATESRPRPDDVNVSAKVRWERP